jgi:hypothetical protein
MIAVILIGLTKGAPSWPFATYKKAGQMTGLWRCLSSLVHYKLLAILIQKGFTDPLDLEQLVH